MTTTRRVVARKAHRCGQCATAGKIEPGHVYLRHVVFPNGETNQGPGPWVIRECLDCANRYQRGHLAEPIPDRQENRYWLGDVVPSYLDPLEVP